MLKIFNLIMANLTAFDIGSGFLILMGIYLIGKFLKDVLDCTYNALRKICFKFGGWTKRKLKEKAANAIIEAVDARMSEREREKLLNIRYGVEESGKISIDKDVEES